MPRVQEQLSRFNLVTGEDSYVSQDAQNALTSRRIQSLIPNRSGLLTRELGEALFLPTQLPSTAGSVFQYDYNDVAGAKQSKRFAATATQLYMDTGAAFAIQTLPTSAGTTSTSALADYPQFCVINNLCHFSDGVTNWIYDGPNNAFVIDGLAIPAGQVLGTDTSVAGTFSCLIGAYYWYTNADETVGRVHESSSSPSTASTGPLTNKQVKVVGAPGTLSTTSGSTAVVGTFSLFDPSHVGQHLWVLGVDYGPIASVANTTHLTLVNVAPATNVTVNYIIAPIRATHLHIYRSETDGSKLGKYLTKILIAGNATPFIIDQSPFVNQASTTILDIDRPVRNDPAPPSKILEVHKSRLFRRREAKPNFFNFTANEEVASGVNGSPQESVPGADVNTLSDIINEDPYPKPSNRIRALKSHADALYIGTEKDTTPLYGDSIDDFGLSQVTAISNGIISRWGMETTPHGLTLFTYDRKLLLYPPISPIYSVTAKDLNVTDQLQEIGLAMRSKFLAIKNSDQDNVRTLWYNYNSRDWLVCCFQDSASAYHTWVYDFSTKGWFELQRGFASVGIFEPIAGQKVLVGGGTDGFIYVIDDLQGTYANATLPAATYRTALIDFGHPDMLHIPDYFEYEVSNPALVDSTTVNFYLDPADADNPGTPIAMPMAAVPNRPNLFRGFFSAAASAAGAPGVLCKRLMLELSLVSDTNAGSFRGVVLKADPVQELAQ